MKYTLTIEAESISDLNDHLQYTQALTVLHEIYHEVRNYLKHEIDPSQDKAEELLERIKEKSARIVLTD